ncbi:MAG TPA: hypothetical protein VFF67_00915 [Thermoplasmata archaeon]|nr:hypothetical protein [Nitrospira sp.]HZY69526.1 hypothetical protein [Thermoplasmata archaeon]
MVGDSLTLRVSVTSAADIGTGTAQLDVGVRSRLKLDIGDVIELKGGKTTGALVSHAPPDDEGKNMVRIEALVRRNAGVSMGDPVLIQRVDCPIADAITIAPVYSGSATLDLGQGLNEFVSKALNRRPFVYGDVFLIQGLFRKGEPLRFLVVATQPKGIIRIGPKTAITVKDSPVSEV